ncbi:MAG: porin family protein [Reyranella sp.]|nr:porin family protein [Reyranella sp.]
MRMRTTFALAIAAVVTAAAPVAAQQQPPAASWSGFYAGLNAGGLFGNTSVPPNGGFGGASGTGSGFAGGVQGGYNYLFGPVILGGEVDFQDSTYAAGLSGGPGRFGNNSATERTPWFSTMRLRAGYAVGSVMPYVTGGAVWGQHSIDGPFGNSVNYWTWTVGGGVECMISDRWSTKIEYLYMGAPSVSLFPGETGNGNLIRVGVNYHF